MLDGLISAGVIHDGSNVSNHSPIYAKFDVVKMDLQTQSYTNSSKINWGLASEEAKSRFKTTLTEKLEGIKLNNRCTDVHCQSAIHKEQLEEYTLSVLEAMEAAGEECLPSTVAGKLARKRKHIPGWNQYVKPYAEESQFWHSLWSSAGKPCSGDLFLMMKSKKHQYKYAVRKLKRCVNIVNNDKLLQTLLQDEKDIYNQVRKLRKKKSCLSSQIDDKVEPSEIAEHFSGVYKKLFNTVKDEAKFVDNIHAGIKDS